MPGQSGKPKKGKRGKDKKVSEKPKSPPKEPVTEAEETEDDDGVDLDAEPPTTANDELWSVIMNDRKFAARLGAALVPLSSIFAPPPPTMRDEYTKGMPYGDRLRLARWRRVREIAIQVEKQEICRSGGDPPDRLGNLFTPDSLYAREAIRHCPTIQQILLVFAHYVCVQSGMDGFIDEKKGERSASVVSEEGGPAVDDDPQPLTSEQMRRKFLVERRWECTKDAFIEVFEKCTKLLIPGCDTDHVKKAVARDWELITDNAEMADDKMVSFYVFQMATMWTEDDTEEAFYDMIAMLYLKTADKEEVDDPNDWLTPHQKTAMKNAGKEIKAWKKRMAEKKKRLAREKKEREKREAQLQAEVEARRAAEEKRKLEEERQKALAEAMATVNKSDDGNTTDEDAETSHDDDGSSPQKKNKKEKKLPGVAKKLKKASTPNTPPARVPRGQDAAAMEALMQTTLLQFPTIKKPASSVASTKSPLRALIAHYSKVPQGTAFEGAKRNVKRNLLAAPTTTTPTSTQSPTAAPLGRTNSTICKLRPTSNHTILPAAPATMPSTINSNSTYTWQAIASPNATMTSTASLTADPNLQSFGNTTLTSNNNHKSLGCLFGNAASPTASSAYGGGANPSSPSTASQRAFLQSLVGNVVASTTAFDPLTLPLNGPPINPQLLYTDELVASAPLPTPMTTSDDLPVHERLYATAKKISEKSLFAPKSADFSDFSLERAIGDRPQTEQQAASSLCDFLQFNIIPERHQKKIMAVLAE